MPVADEHRVGVLTLAADDFDLLLGALAEKDVPDADLIGEIADFRLAITGDEQCAVDLVSRREVVDEGSAVRAGRVPKAVRCRVRTVDDDHTLQSAGLWRERPVEFGLSVQEFPAAGQFDAASGDGSLHSLSGWFADLTDVVNDRAFLHGRGHDGTRQRMFREPFETSDQREDFVRFESGGGQLLDKSWFAVGERAGLVEDERAAGVGGFE